MGRKERESWCPSTRTLKPAVASAMMATVRETMFRRRARCRASGNILRRGALAWQWDRSVSVTASRCRK
jgi:hypothetical protein